MLTRKQQRTIVIARPAEKEKLRYKGKIELQCAGEAISRLAGRLLRHIRLNGDDPHEFIHAGCAVARNDDAAFFG